VAQEPAITYPPAPPAPPAAGESEGASPSPTK
jgi:hypothetical protein